MKSKKYIEKTTVIKVKQWETTYPMLISLYNEIQILSKKKPDGHLNKTKIALINNVLADCLVVLHDEPTIKYLQLLDEELVPQYSDVMLMVSQVKAAMDSYKSRYYGWDTAQGASVWSIE
jgi:hypothetical protein